MTREQWNDIAADELLARWPHATLSDATLDAWYLDLEDLDPDQVTTAIRALGRDGREFAPNGAQVRNKVIELGVDAPEFAQVLVELRRLFAAGYCYPEGQGGPDAERRRELLERRPPLVQAFVGYLGASQLREGMTGEGGDEARLRQKWDAFMCRGTRELAYRGLEPAGLPQLERIEASRDGPRQLGAAVKDVLTTHTEERT